MSEHNITVEGGTSIRLPTAGKYCDRDIVITAEGGTEDFDADSVLGTRIFNHKLNLDVGVGTFGLEFTSNGVNYNQIYIGDLGPPLNVMRYQNADVNTPVYSFSEASEYGAPALWWNDGYRHIKITKEPEDPVFKSWLKDNTHREGELDTSDADATAADIRLGAIAYARGKRLIGEAEIGGGSYEIFGSHVIAPEWSGYYIVPEEDVTIDFSKVDAYAYYRDDSDNVAVAGIGYITFRADGTITIKSGGGTYSLEYDGAEWHSEFLDEGDVIFGTYDDFNRVVEFESFFEVTKEEYTLLQGLFTYEDNTAYTIGWQRGNEQNQEILSELMEWEMVATSSLCYVNIYNKHTTKYLLASMNIWDANHEEAEKYIDICLAPDEDGTFGFPAGVTHDAHWEIYIDEVRFSEDGT